MSVCCKADKFGWCVFLDADIIVDGKHYCIFHAPAEHKEIGNEEFNDLVYSRIQAVIDLGDKAEERRIKKSSLSSVACDLSGIVFPGRIEFSRYDKGNPLPSILFQEAKFSGDAYFREAEFSGETYFWEAEFNGNAYFQKAEFSGEVLFNDVTFNEKATFTQAIFDEQARFIQVIFKGNAWFDSVVFSKNTWFDKSNFFQRAWFKEAKFHKHASFIETIFDEITDFRHAIFSEDVNFSFVNSYKTNFQQAEIHGTPDFSRSIFEGPATFTRTLFHKPAYFDHTIFCAGANFSFAVFKEYANFEETWFFGKNSFEGTFFENWAFFNNPEFHQVNFKGCMTGATIVIDRADLSNVPLRRMNIESFRFNVCRWPSSNGHSIVCDEKHASTSHRRLEEIYRRLKIGALNSGDQMMASIWHYREKEICRKNMSDKDNARWAHLFLRPWWARLLLPSCWAHRFLRLMLWVYKAISGFGERPGRAFFILFLFAVAPFAWFLIPELWKTGLHFGLDWERIHTATTKALCGIPFAKTAHKLLMDTDAANPGTIKGLHIAGAYAWQLLITIQAALFGMALRNKFRR